MLQRDFILRAIEELAGAIAAVAGLRRKNELQEALKAVEDAKSKLPLVPGLIDQLAPEALLRVIEDVQLREQLAALFQHEAELCYLLGHTARAVRCLSRSKALLGG